MMTSSVPHSHTPMPARFLLYPLDLPAQEEPVAAFSPSLKQVPFQQTTYYGSYLISSASIKQFVQIPISTWVKVRIAPPLRMDQIPISDSFPARPDRESL
jgi:hypothetical protein